MKTRVVALALLAWALAGAVAIADEGGAHRIGAGANYWVTVEDMEADVDENGFAYLATYQYRPGLLGLGIDVEMLPDFLGEDAYAPQAYLILGKTIYAAAGVGILNVDGDWADDPFYSLRAGLDLNLLSNLYLDLYGNYRFEETSDLGGEDTEIDADTVFLGAALRLAL